MLWDPVGQLISTHRKEVVKLGTTLTYHWIIEKEMEITIMRLYFRVI